MTISPIQEADPILTRLSRIYEDQQRSGIVRLPTELETIQASVLTEGNRLLKDQLTLNEKTLATCAAWRRVAYTLAAVVVVLSCIVVQLLIGG